MRVLTVKDTLKEVRKDFDKSSFVRFGDGDIMMMAGWEGKQGNQFNSKELMNEIREAVRIQDPNFKIATSVDQPREPKDTLRESPDYEGIFTAVGYNKGLKKALKKFCNRKVYLSPIFLHFLAVYKQDIFKRFVREYIHPLKILYVGGKHLNKEPLHKIFGIDKFIEIPSYQAYDTIDEWYPQVTKVIDNYDMTLLSMGFTSSAFQKRLWKKGYKSFDVGSLADGIVGNWKERGWIEPAKHHLKKL